MFTIQSLKKPVCGRVRSCIKISVELRELTFRLEDIYLEPVLQVPAY